MLIETAGEGVLVNVLVPAAGVDVVLMLVHKVVFGMAVAGVLTGLAAGVDSDLTATVVALGVTGPGVVSGKDCSVVGTGVVLGTAGTGVVSGEV